MNVEILQNLQVKLCQKRLLFIEYQVYPLEEGFRDKTFIDLN